MNRLSIEMLINLINEYNPLETEKIKKAYAYASEKHYGQKRQSGEDYIVHPLMVAYILAQMHADADTVCAGLLHDTLEDTNASKEEIRALFNESILSLVDGVTKLSTINFSSKEEQNLANTRKIITGIIYDPRIIIIKLADRLHNMRTLDFKSEAKQIEIANETMSIYVPLASYIGAYHIKTELEDLSFKYLNPGKYHEILESKFRFEADNEESIFAMQKKIHSFLLDKNVPNYMKIRTKNIYGIYKKMQKGFSLYEMHDLVALKIVVDMIDECYLSLGYVHSLYKPINYKFKDYIASPKTNMYQSLHTTIFGLDNQLLQVQIRTDAMDRANSFGLTGYWDNNHENTKDVMLEDLKSKYQFFQTLSKLNLEYPNNADFIYHVKRELFSDIIHVFDSDGSVIELPKGATIIDFAYKVNSGSSDVLIGAYVNNNLVGPNHVLNNNDRVCPLYNKKNVDLKRERMKST